MGGVKAKKGVREFLDLKVSMKLNLALMQISSNWRRPLEGNDDEDNYGCD